jgi:hypothetical protein
MHSRFWVWVGLYFISSAFADSAETSKITEVVVYGDRARISREITVNVPGGDSQFELAGLPGDLDENSVGIAVRSGGSVIIRGMDVQREFLSENADARSLDLLKQLDQLQNQKRALQSQQGVLEDKREFFRKLNRDAEIGILSHRKQNQRKYQIAIQNFRKNPIKLTVYDQIPISQDNDITVTPGQDSTKPTGVDKDSGKISWDLDLAPSEKKIIEFDYTVEWPAGKTIE